MNPIERYQDAIVDVVFANATTPELDIAVDNAKRAKEMLDHHLSRGWKARLRCLQARVKWYSSVNVVRRYRQALALKNPYERSEK